MAYATRELFDQGSTKNPNKRIFPLSVQPKTFAANGAAPTLKKGIAVAYDTAVNKWKAWTNGGANGTGTVSGFLMDDLVLDAANDTIGIVMIRGQIHFDDIELNGETAANLKTAVRSGPRGLGLDIVGLDQVR